MSARSSVDPAVSPKVLNGRTRIGIRSFASRYGCGSGRDGSGGDCQRRAKGSAPFFGSAAGPAGGGAGGRRIHEAPNTEGGGKPRRNTHGSNAPGGPGPFRGHGGGGGAPGAAR